ncbi:hypothetical protein CROQUDRAFT_79395, partial [Cronartium quercuum f. sp. fusiforme G11]
MLPVLYLSYPLLFLLVVKSTRSAVGVELHDQKFSAVPAFLGGASDGSRIELSFGNFLPSSAKRSKELKEELFPLTKKFAVQEIEKEKTSWSTFLKNIQVIFDSLTSKLHSWRGEQALLQVAEAHQDLAGRMSKTDTRLENIARQIKSLPFVNLVSSDVSRSAHATAIGDIVDDGIDLLKNEDLPISSRLWVHQIIEWISHFYESEEPQLKIQKPYEAQLSRIQLERYLLQDTLLQERSYSQVVVTAGGSDGRFHNALVEVMERVSLLKELKDKAPILLKHTANKSLQDMFDALMVVKSIQEPAYEARADLLALIYESIHTSIDTAPQAEKHLSYEVLKHMLKFVPEHYPRYMKMRTRDGNFAREATRIELRIFINEVLSSKITKKLRDLFEPLQNFETLGEDTFKLMLQAALSHNLLDDQEHGKLYLAITSVCAQSNEMDNIFLEYLHTYPKYLERFATIWESIDAGMSFETVPTFSYEYQLFTRSPEFLEYAVRYLIVRPWVTSKNAHRKTLAKMAMKLSTAWYKRITNHDSVKVEDLLKAIKRDLTSANVGGTPTVVEGSKQLSRTESLSGIYSLQLYQLLAHVLRYLPGKVRIQYKNSIKKGTALWFNLQVLAQFTLGDSKDSREMLLLQTVCTDFSRWIQTQTPTNP